MTAQADMLAGFTGAGGGGMPFVPDLTLWYDWHRTRGTLPDEWKGHSLPQIARALGVPIWCTASPWRVETPGVEVQSSEGEGERSTRYETSVGALTARWTLGPDGDWWQMEYPVKSEEDLQAALEIVRSRSYVLDPGGLAELADEVGDDGVLAIEIPGRPYTDLVQEFLGWSEGLMILMDEPPAIQAMEGILEEKLGLLVAEIAKLPGRAVLCPDNLDGQFVSPPAFQDHLADSYRRSAEVFHGEGKHVVVHIGGPIRNLLGPLAEAGVDGVEGVAGPPQGDATLSQAREVAGQGLTLWGGIPQEFLLSAHDEQAFQDAVAQAVREAKGDARTILGVADRVPVGAELDRLRGILSMLEGM